jgi:DNA invertase Pin-like site-specific DNA recombinase
MKRAVLYARVSTFDQRPETQLLDLRRLAEQRGFEVVNEYTDKISGAKAKRPALDQMLAAAHRREFDTVLVWAADRLARSVRHFLEVLDTAWPPVLLRRRVRRRMKIIPHSGHSMVSDDDGDRIGDLS